jgi:hypothetical protein
VEEIYKSFFFKGNAKIKKVSGRIRTISIYNQQKLQKYGQDRKPNKTVFAASFHFFAETINHSHPLQ